MLVGRGGLVTVLVGRCVGWSMWVSPFGWLAMSVGRCGLVAMGWSLWVGHYVGQSH